MNIESLLSSLEGFIPELDKIDEKVSKVNVGWQIDHSFNVILAVCKAMHASDPTTYTAKYSLMRTILLNVGRFPRGKAKAPKSTRPRGEITEDSLREKLIVVKTQLKSIDSLHPNAYFHHPIFKNLNLKRTKIFLRHHTYHHYKIIQDILR